MITEFNKYLNEGLTDKMRPKSHSQVLNAIMKMPEWKRYDIIKFYGKEQYFTKEELELYKNIPKPINEFEKGFKERDFNKIKKAVEDDPNILRNRNDSILSPVRSGDIIMVEFLINIGFNVTLDDLPLRLAIIDGQTEIVKLLLKSGARPDKNQLEIALNKYSYKPEIVEMLFKYANKKEISKIERWGFVYRGEHRPKEELLDESIRDKMTPVTKEEINNKLKELSVEDKNRLMLDLIRKEDLEMMLVMLNNGLKVTTHMINTASTVHKLTALSLLKYIREKQKKSNKVINEGLIDLMKGKSKEEIKEAEKKILYKITKIMVDSGKFTERQAHSKLLAAKYYVFDKYEDGWSYQEIANKFIR